MSTCPAKENVKIKHIAGKIKKSRCIIKRRGGGSQCPCGCFGKKMDHVPYPYQDNESFLVRAHKWIKKKGIKLIKKIREKYEEGFNEDIQN